MNTAPFDLPIQQMSAVMSNHYHVVLFIDEEKAKQWSINEVIERWHRLHKGTLLTQQ